MSQIEAKQKNNLHLFANWKMFALGMRPEQYFEEFEQHLTLSDSFAENRETPIGFAVPFTQIAPITQHLSHSSLASMVSVGAQNMHSALGGAYTGEIAYPLLKEAGAQWVLLGHSERRTVLQETDAEIAAKMTCCEQNDFPSLLCVGERLEDRETGKSEEVVLEQLRSALETVQAKHRVWIAYEPVWAIGSGKSAGAAEVTQMHSFIYDSLLEMGFEAPGIRILYGGSVNVTNCGELAGIDRVDGFLVGKASLTPKTFAEMANILFNQ